MPERALACCEHKLDEGAVALLAPDHERRFVAAELRARPALFKPLPQLVNAWDFEPALGPDFNGIAQLFEFVAQF